MSSMAEEETGDGIESPQTAHVFNERETELLSDLERQEEATRSQVEADESSSECVKIQKVPNNIKLLGQVTREHYYTPTEISIGPIHANNARLARKDLKLRLAARFVAESGRSRENLLGLVKDDFGAIKNCFEESVVEPFDDDGLLRLLFLDACFVLQFMYGNQKLLPYFRISNGLHNSIQRDLFLLENQLPTRLMNLLIISSKLKELKERISVFVMCNLISPLAYYSPRMDTNVAVKPVHLLDIFRKQVLYPLHDGHNSTPSKQRRAALERPRSFRNVQDLKSAGIKIKPSRSSTFCDVSFSRRWFFSATLRVPPLIVDSSSVSKLLNLVAFEMCPDNYDCDFGVSSYMYLMDSLVDTEQDVRDLRAAHVLRNRLGSDEEVAKLFNEIGSNLLSNDRYKDVQEAIQKHYENKYARWWAQVNQDYFSSPWKVLALIGGVLVLLFGGVSAYYAMFPRQGDK